MSKLDDILFEPLQPVDYELLKRGDVATSEEITSKVKTDIKALFLELAKKPHIIPKSALNVESVKQGYNFYHKKLVKRIEEL